MNNKSFSVEPCPFDGTNDKLNVSHSRGRWFVECERCGACGPLVAPGDRDEESANAAIAAWNARWEAGVVALSP
jgi:Lar family restriction alleviation protein